MKLLGISRFADNNYLKFVIAGTKPLFFRKLTNHHIVDFVDKMTWVKNSRSPPKQDKMQIKQVHCETLSQESIFHLFNYTNPMTHPIQQFSPKPTKPSISATKVADTAILLFLSAFLEKSLHTKHVTPTCGT